MIETPERVARFYEEVFQGVHQDPGDVVDLLVDEESSSLAELEDFIGIPIKFQVEALYTQEQFDVVLL